MCSSLSPSHWPVLKFIQNKSGGRGEGKKKITVMNHPKENEVKVSCFHSHERLKAEENI